MTTCSEAVRKHVLEHYISPARGKGFKTVTVRAGDVHSHFRWTGRVPSVCQALSSRKFQREAGVELVEKSGPPSGLSTTVEFTYHLLDRQAIPQKGAARHVPAGSSGPRKPPTLLDLFGIGKAAFREAGGGEALLQAERAEWGPDPWEHFQNRAYDPANKGKSS